MVTDGSRLNQLESREARTPQQLRSVDSVIKSLHKARRNNTIYVKLLGTDAGAVVNGEVLSSLPRPCWRSSKPTGTAHVQSGPQCQHR
jgi:hypothetical protein